MEKVKRKVTYRLYVSARQEQALYNALRLHKQLYNTALEQRIYVYRQHKKSLNFYDQCKELTSLRKEIKEYEILNAQSCQVTLKRLDLAFMAFYRRVKSNSTPGFPRFKSLERYSGFGYKTHGDGWKLLSGENGKNGYLRLSGIGQIKIRGQAKNLGQPKTCEIQHKQGKWYASITVDCEVKRVAGTKAIGIDWGLTTFATIATSDNKIEKIENPRFIRKNLARLKIKQQELSRKKLGSNNRKKAKIAVVRLHNKITNSRKDFLHKTTSALVSNSALISVEELNTKEMTVAGKNPRKKTLNREILSAAPGAFHQMLKYKAEEAGIEWIEVPTRQVKPTQTCHVCGKQEKKPLFTRTHVCDCGASCSRDANAAKVILNWALFGNASGQELSRCGELASADFMKHETPSIAA
jgi:putative transposase